MKFIINVNYILWLYYTLWFFLRKNKKLPLWVLKLNSVKYLNLFQNFICNHFLQKFIFFDLIIDLIMLQWNDKDLFRISFYYVNLRKIQRVCLLDALSIIQISFKYSNHISLNSAAGFEIYPASIYVKGFLKNDTEFQKRGIKVIHNIQMTDSRY